jgi:AraC-like DNA-binding protein
MLEQRDGDNLPLAKNCLFKSGDLDEARAIVASKFCDHRLDRANGTDKFLAVHNRAEGQAASLNFISYGADVEIEPGELESFYLIQIPLSGQALIDNSAGTVNAGPGLGSVLNPHRHTTMRWHEGCSHLLLQIDIDALGRVAERLLGRSLSHPVTFETALDQYRSGVNPWIKQLHACFSLADKDAVFSIGNPHTQAIVEEQLIEGLLLCQPSDIAPALASGVVKASNVHVRRAVQFIHDNLSYPITIGKIADALQISPRSLQLGFKSELDQSPLQYLREARLQEARHQLLNSPESVKIGDICERVGFSHFGRFSVEYRRRFGESPHQTPNMKSLVPVLSDKSAQAS